MTDISAGRLPQPGTLQDRIWALVKSFFEGLDMGVMVVQRSTAGILWSSPVAQRQLGYSADEIAQRELAALYADAEEFQRLARRATEAFDRVGVFRGEIAMRRRDGSALETEQSWSLMFDPERFQIAVRDIGKRRAAERALEQSRDELRQLSVHLQSLREEERTRIARGLQEELGQELTALTLDLKILRERIGEEHRVTLDRLADSAKRTVDHVQEVCAHLRPAILDHLGPVAAIEWVADDFEKRTGMRCRTDLDARLETLRDPYAVVLLRIVQESLVNIRRHAGASAVSIRLGRD